MNTAVRVGEGIPHLRQNARVMSAMPPGVGRKTAAAAPARTQTSEAEMRIGVSVPIPEPYSTRLTRARVEAGDPLARSVPPHITLVPPTDLRAEELARVEHHLRSAAAANAPFIVDLAGTATFWPISPVVFVRLAAGKEGCTRLQQSLTRGVLAQELKFPYHPHVTIAHGIGGTALNAAQLMLADFEATFPVVHFCLYEHGSDGVWREIADFALQSETEATARRNMHHGPGFDMLGPCLPD